MRPHAETEYTERSCPLLLADTAYVVQDQKVTGADGGDFNVRYIVPVVDDVNETFPVLVYTHGGGQCTLLCRLQCGPVTVIYDILGQGGVRAVSNPTTTSSAGWPSISNSPS